MTYFPKDFPKEIVEHIVDFLGSHHDRNTVSTVCKELYDVERLSRRSVFVGNCYAVRPERVMERFPGMKSLSVKGKPHFADFDSVSSNWGGSACHWIKAAAHSCPELEELRLKRMVIDDVDLQLLASKFSSNLKSLVLISCEGFSTNGLAAVATKCSNLRELDLQGNEVEDKERQWLSRFPDSYTSLVSLNIACVKGQVNPSTLKRLVARSPNLRSLKLNRATNVESLNKILARAPHIVELGTGSFTVHPDSEAHRRLKYSFQNCESLRSLSGFWDASPSCLLAVYPVCSNLTFLNLSYAPAILDDDLTNFICRCVNLQKLWVLDFIGDEGLADVASACKELQELRVFTSNVNGDGTSAVTEKGLVAISSGCPKLNSLLYCCRQMTNAALISVAKNCPHFTRFRLCIPPWKLDPSTSLPLDEGFGEVVRLCKNLRRLSVSGYLTNKVFEYIGMYAERLEMLSIAFAGESDKGMVDVLNGCKKLRKLEIKDCPLGDGVLLNNVAKHETMRSLGMSSCKVTMGVCRSLAAKMPTNQRLNVEIINDSEASAVAAENITDSHEVKKIYVYRTMAGRRTDAPYFVWTL